MTEGTWVPHPSAGFNARVPRFYGEDALAGWKRTETVQLPPGASVMPTQPSFVSMKSVLALSIAAPSAPVGALPLLETVIDGVVAPVDDRAGR